MPRNEVVRSNYKEGSNARKHPVSSQNVSVAPITQTVSQKHQGCQLNECPGPSNTVLKRKKQGSSRSHHGDSLSSVVDDSQLVVFGSAGEPSNIRSVGTQNSHTAHSFNRIINIDEISPETRSNSSYSINSSNNRESDVRARQLEADEVFAMELQEQLYNESNVAADREIDENVAFALQQGSLPHAFSSGTHHVSHSTYDRPYIQRWLKSGNRTCPRSQQVLSHINLTPNHLIRDMISQWCKNNGVELPDSLQYSDEGIAEPDRHCFLYLLEKMSSSLLDQKEAAKELRSLTKRAPSFRALFGESVDAIPQLLNPLSQYKSRNEVHPDLQEDLITTVLNLSILDNNKKHVAETPMVIPLLLDALRSGTVQTRSNAAAAFFTLSALDSNKALIGKSGALKPLIDLLEDGHPLAMKDVASAVFNLCIIHENKLRAVRSGAVRVILEKIKKRIHVDELLAILAMLSTNHTAVEELGELGGVHCLLSLIRESSCARNKENCIAILHTICFNDRTKWREMREEENNYGTISQVAQDGTSRGKRKASGILERLNRAVNLIHTA